MKDIKQIIKTKTTKFKNLQLHRDSKYFQRLRTKLDIIDNLEMKCAKKLLLILIGHAVAY